MAKVMLPLLRDEDKFRCVACGDCVRACFPGVLELQKQKVVLVDVKAVLRVPILKNPEKCDHEGRCLVACPQKVYPCLYPQEIEEVKRNAESLIEEAKNL